MRESVNGPMRWHRSSRCADTTCVEVGADEERVYLRDGKKPDGAVLCFTRTQWEDFLGGVERGEFN